ncbi:MAG TPA: hypothetical protein VM597_08115 [Gemmataceae bacterium]|nr:hypothetical protein [Gemmataceae bacterium]
MPIEVRQPVEPALGRDPGQLSPDIRSVFRGAAGGVQVGEVVTNVFGQGRLSLGDSGRLGRGDHAGPDPVGRLFQVREFGLGRLPVSTPGRDDVYPPGPVTVFGEVYARLDNDPTGDFRQARGAGFPTAVPPARYLNTFYRHDLSVRR